MGQYKLIWDELAREDIAEIWEYIAFDSKTAAQKVIRNIQSAAKSLKNNPLIGQEEEFLKEYKLGHRYLVYSHYKIIYRMYEHSVFISTVFDTRQKLSKLRKIIKKR